MSPTSPAPPLPFELWQAIYDAALSPLPPRDRQSLQYNFRLASVTFNAVVESRGELVLTSRDSARLLAQELHRRQQLEDKNERPPIRILWVEGEVACEDLRAVVRGAGTGVRELRVLGLDADGDSLLRCLYPGLFPELRSLVIGPSDMDNGASPVVNESRLLQFVAQCPHLIHISASANWAPHSDALPFMPPSPALPALAALRSFQADDWGGEPPAQVLLPVLSASHHFLRHLTIGGRNNPVPLDLAALLQTLVVLETLALPQFRGHHLIEGGCLGTLNTLRELEVHEPTRNASAFFGVVVGLPALELLTLRLVAWDRATLACEKLGEAVEGSEREEVGMEMKLRVLRWDHEDALEWRASERERFEGKSGASRARVGEKGGRVSWDEVLV